MESSIPNAIGVPDVYQNLNRGVHISDADINDTPHGNITVEIQIGRPNVGDFQLKNILWTVCHPLAERWKQDIELGEERMEQQWGIAWQWMGFLHRVVQVTYYQWEDTAQMTHVRLKGRLVDVNRQVISQKRLEQLFAFHRAEYNWKSTIWDVTNRYCHWGIAVS
jgi:hypothetical protein